MSDKRQCDWCNAKIESPTVQHARLVKHKGKLELWCNECTTRDAKGLPGGMKSKDSVKRMSERVQRDIS